MSEVLSLRGRAEAATADLAPLLVRAERLATAIMPGGHGRKRVGAGDDFWQYRPLEAGDTMRMIDWRRSARSDAQFVRQQEWQIAQSVLFWVDRARSMQFSSGPNLPDKIDRAQLVALTIAILLSRGGERIGLLGADLPARAGATQLHRFAHLLAQPEAQDFAAPNVSEVVQNASVVMVSDFLADLDKTQKALDEAAAKGVRGLCLQILDPVEESFPFQGRAVFQSVGATMRHETLQARSLADRYLARLADRKARLAQACRRAGWSFATHHTNEPAQAAVTWVYNMLEGPR